MWLSDCDEEQETHLWTSLIAPAPPRGWYDDIECGGPGCGGPAVVCPRGPDISDWGCCEEACWPEPTWTDRIAASISFRRCHRSYDFVRIFLRRKKLDYNENFTLKLLLNIDFLPKTPFWFVSVLMLLWKTICDAKTESLFLRQIIRGNQKLFRGKLPTFDPSWSTHFLSFFKLFLFPSLVLDIPLMKFLFSSSVTHIFTANICRKTFVDIHAYIHLITSSNF